MQCFIYLFTGAKRYIPRSHIFDEWSDTRGQGNADRHLLWNTYLTLS